MPDTVIRLAETHPRCTVLGPGNRFVVWVQGCPLHCAECTSPAWIPQTGGVEIGIGELADRIIDAAIDGLTLSGGEPFAQAHALAELIRRVRTVRDLSVMSYTGYVVEHLRRHGDAAQHRLLESLDILVDGPYLANRHAALRWRGSANQRLHYLTGRHRPEPDEDSAGLQIELGADGGIRWLGVPTVRQFRVEFERQLGLTPAPPVERP
ncbi:anaerobic ribonucleoside-triphosphate reductase activating protein [Kribbella sp. VKM Ac-2569]|uniref:4Fe-4S single cluster domain-containing protein n=1 Tax=Kribbella sp. VKM Ac-2569 TaxID=2512220 RepID=UPI00102B843B|nr:4Fe-4S single cluster domain-containing protein [Kribbella sp. VKM Ac-2569]RZT17508.1 anaerobic ribonucleoside-triphosphate reductase activating protein [Kribbella sp. VKM Ac-2569]